MTASATESGAGSDPDAAASAASAAARWTALEELFQEALARGPDARAAYLEASCPDAGTRHEVEALLVAHGRRGALDDLVDDVMPSLFARREPPAAPGPSVHARYRILERLGGGGMGVVYRARDQRLDRDVALKFLPPHLSADQAAKKRFLVEARAAAALEHPNICTVHEIGDTDDGQLYIVMACYDGETLARRLTRGALPVDEALRVAGEIARGLAKAHERGIVHRDVKPANVMITGDGLVKILDFGIAKLGDATIAQTVGAIGTLAYMSPEQAFGEAVDHRTDVWALGVVLYEMLAGVRPFRGPGEQAMLVAALTADPEPIAGLRADVPAEVDTVIRHALAKRPAERFASAAELLGALVRCAVGAPTDGGPGAERTLPGGNRVRLEDALRDTARTRAGERRHVTVVACALPGYGALIEQLAPEETDRVLARVRDAATEIAAHHGGIVNHFSGDEFVMLFGVPTAHEDDFLRGVRTALALRARVAEIGASSGVGLRFRAGVHAGAAVAQRLRAGDRRFRVTGAPMDVAVQLAALAEADTILVSPECRRLVAPFVETMPAAPVSLRAGAEPVVPHRVLGESGIASRLEHAERNGLTPYAGRARELRALEEQLASALSGVGHAALVIGEAGTGKSRLLYELRRRTTGAGMRLVVGRCDSYGETTPFLPFVQVVHDALDLPRGGAPGALHDRVATAVHALDASLGSYLPLYLALLSIPSERHPVPEHWQGRRFQLAMLDALTALVTRAARRAPILLLLEDWHWADDASGSALRQLVQVVDAVPLMVVVTARPEGAVGWEDSEHQTRLHLGPLDLAASEAIARAVFRADRVRPELAAQLHERTGGNPFFLEEVCLALREEAAVALIDGEASAVTAAGAVQVPDTVQGVVGTRIDRLDADARDVLLVASVIGREFSRGVLADVVDPALELTEALDRLKTAGLVQQTNVAPEPTYRFKHVITQEVAYDSLLERERTALHAVVARSIERRYSGPRLEEQVDRLAQHFARAGLWGDAVGHGITAADRATALGQYGDALGLLEQVEGWLRRLNEDAGQRDTLAGVLLREERLCETLGDRARQVRIADALIALLAPHGTSARLAEAFLRQGDVYTLVRRFDAAERALETATRLSIELGDRMLERNALRSIVLLRSFEDRHAEALATIERVLAIGRECGEQEGGAGDLATLGGILRRMGERRRALDVLEAGLAHAATARPVGRCALYQVIGALHGELGDPETALQYMQWSLDEAQAQQLPVAVSFSLSAIANTYQEQGRIEEALGAYARNAEASRRSRYLEGLAQALLSSGQLLFRLGRHAEAVPHLREAARSFAQLEDHDVEAQVWRRVADGHERLGEWAEARGAWELVRTLRRAAADRQGEIDALEGIGRAGRREPDTSAAVCAYDAALRIAEQLGDRVRALCLRNALGIAHWEGARDDEALAQYEAALGLCRETHDRVHEGLILNSLGAVLHRLGRLEDARSALEEGVHVNRATGQQRLESHALATLGEVHAAAGRLDDARRAVEASLAIRRTTGDRLGEGWMLARLARILLAEDAVDDARSAVAAARTVLDEIPDAALADTLDQLRRTIDTTDHPPTS